MAHKHSVHDSDSHFSINPTTRVIKNESSRKTTLIQYDHNSERFTFEIPRYVEEHDMSICNVVEIHYLNVDAVTKATHADMYRITDLQISPEDENVVICSWLISQNATRFVGPLNFLVRFACVTDGVIDYAWNTAIFTGISVSSGIWNTEIIVEQYADVLEQWRNNLGEMSGGTTDYNKLINKPFNYVGTVKLNELVDEGVYYFDRYDEGEFFDGGEIKEISGLVVVKIVTEDEREKTIQIIYTPNKIISRFKWNDDDDVNVTWFWDDEKSYVFYDGNMPIKFYDSIDLDRLTEVGTYITKGYGIIENGEYVYHITGFSIVIMVNAYGTTYQMVWNPSGTMQRVKTGEDGEWGAWNNSTYRIEEEPILPLTPTMVDGVTTYTLDRKKKYTVAIDTDCAFVLPNVEAVNGVYPRSAILIYAYFDDAVSVAWGDVLFYNNEIPDISPGWYDLIFTFSPNAQKWTVGILEKGEGV